MKRIGLFLPFLLLVVFALIFHPSMKIHLLEFTDPALYIFFSPQMFFLLATIFIISKNKIPPHQIGITVHPVKKNIAWGLIAGITPYVLMFTAHMIMGRISPSEPSSERYELSGWTLFSYFVFAPIAEMFFRGVLFKALQETYSLTIAILTSSLLFAASHSSIIIGPFALGIFAAILTHRTKSIFPAMIFHSLCNGLPWFYINYCHNLQPFEKWLFFRL